MREPQYTSLTVAGDSGPLSGRRTSREEEPRVRLKRFSCAVSNGGEFMSRSCWGFCGGVDTAVMSISSCSSCNRDCLPDVCFLRISADGARSGTAIGISTMSSHTHTRALLVSSSGPRSGVLSVSTTFHACPFMTAICLAYMRSLKSASCEKHLRSADCVSLHHCFEVRRGRKWRRVASEKGWPMSETGRKSQPKG